MNELPAALYWEGPHLAASFPDHEVRFTSRFGGVSKGSFAELNLGRFGDDDPTDVRTNYDLLSVELAVERDRIAQGVQIHGDEVQRRDDVPGRDEALLACDGQATHVARVPCLVLVADCLPVALLCDGAVAMVHAGWKGLDAGVLEDGVRALRELGGTGPVSAIIGPGAGACCYEVGPELHARFGVEGPTLDLKAIAADRLRAAGAIDVADVGLCTICDPRRRFFSVRRDGPATGRQAGVAWLS